MVNALEGYSDSILTLYLLARLYSKKIITMESGNVTKYLLTGLRRKGFILSTGREYRITIFKVNETFRMNKKILGFLQMVSFRYSRIILHHFVITDSQDGRNWPVSE